MRHPTEPPDFTPNERSVLVAAFCADVEREIVLADERTDTVAALLRALPARVTVRAVPLADGTLHPNLSYRNSHGGLVTTARAAADDLIEQGKRATLLASFGPDPKRLLVQRLVAVGVPEAEAVRYEDRIWRLEDGRVVGLVDGARREFLEDGMALTTVARAIVNERKRGVPAPGSAPATEDPESSLRARVAAAF